MGVLQRTFEKSQKVDNFLQKFNILEIGKSMDYRNPMYYETPIDQKMDQVHRKLARLHADHETLAAENRQLHQQVSYAAIKNQVRLANIPHSDKALQMLSIATTPAPNNQVKMSANNSRWSSAEIFL